MRILKFGGSSVGSPERIRLVIDIVLGHPSWNARTFGQNGGETPPPPIHVVVSAFQGITDTLIRVAKGAATGTKEHEQLLEEIRARHLAAVSELIGGTPLHGPTESVIITLLGELRDIVHGIGLVGEASPRTLDHVCSFGERLSAMIIAQAMRLRLPNTSFLDARSIVITDDRFGAARVDFEETNARINRYFSGRNELQVVTGFIGSTVRGETTTLGRGGSDYTAAIIGAALRADEIEIWTDVDGVMTADPRRVERAFPIPRLTYEEAMELCHFGAKVIYPPALQPAFDAGIPIRVKNSFHPATEGTLISSELPRSGYPICGISSVSHIALIRIQGSGLIGVAGMARRFFGALADHEINIILITQSSSEHSICVAISPDAAAVARQAVEREFALEMRARQVDPIIVEEPLSVIAVVGENMRHTPGIAGKLFQALGRNGINVIAIAQGSSELNISVVTEANDEAKALNALHDAFFLSEVTTIHLYLIGAGRVGTAFLRQLEAQYDALRRNHRLELRLVAIARSERMAFSTRGIPLSEHRRALDENGEPMSVHDFVERMLTLNLPNSVFIDCTASEEIAAVYERVLANAISIVTPNKRATSGSLNRYHELKRAAARANVQFLYETTVGAALPVLSTLRDLIASGDEILRIEAILSGTLSFIFNSFCPGTRFSTIVREAMHRGYTEPDPRDDLSGKDVGRKLLILAREIGLPLEEEDIHTRSLVPERARSARSVEDFFSLLEECDSEFEELRACAEKQGKVLRYIGWIEGGEGRVELTAVGQGHPFYGLSGTDNIVSFTSTRYHDQPLVVKGPGAGTEVTAAGIFADLLRTTRSL